MTSPDEPAVSFDVGDGGVVVIGLTRPQKRNAMLLADSQRIGDLVRQCGKPSPDYYSHLEIGRSL